MSKVQNDGVSITLKTRLISTSYKITSLTYEGDFVTRADLLIDYIKQEFYQDDEAEEGEGVETIVTSTTESMTTTALGTGEANIDYEAAVTLALSSKL